LKCGLVECVLAIFDQLSDETGESLLKFDVVIKVVFVKPFEDCDIGIVRRLFEVLSPSEVVVQVDPSILSISQEVYAG